MTHMAQAQTYNSILYTLYLVPVLYKQRAHTSFFPSQSPNHFCEVSPKASADVVRPRGPSNEMHKPYANFTEAHAHVNGLHGLHGKLAVGEVGIEEIRFFHQDQLPGRTVLLN